MRLLFVLLLMAGCGVQEPQYVAYEEPETPTTPTGSSESPPPAASDGTAAPATEDLTQESPEEPEQTCDETAMAVFLANVAGAVDNTCSNCHRTISKMPMESGKDDANRAALYNYSEGATLVLTTKIYDPVSHPGGDQSGVLSEQAIDEWLAAEAACL